MSLLPEIIVSVIAMLVAGLGSHFAKSYFAEKSKKAQVFVKKGGVEIEIPEVTDLESLRKRLHALALISPQVAILEGWQFIEQCILKRASSLEGLDPIRGYDVISIAQRLSGFPSSTIEKLRYIRKFRNLVAHSADLRGEEAELIRVVEEIVPLIEELGPEFKKDPLKA